MNNNGLFLLRCLVFVGIIFVMVYCISPDLEQWRIQVQDKYKHWAHTMKDQAYDIPVERRRPTQTVTEFYSLPIEIRRAQFVKPTWSRSKQDKPSV